MLHTFLPADRAHALAAGEDLPARSEGVVLFADVAGFTPLAESLEASYGTQRGAEVLADALTRTFGAITELVHARHGSIVAFAGDALTCWFAGDRALAAVACALEMQAALAELGDVDVDGRALPQPVLKVGIAGGGCTRLVVGDPDVQQYDVVSGAAVDRAAEAEKRCDGGQVFVASDVLARLGDAVVTAEERSGHVRVTRVQSPPPPEPWPPLPDGSLREDALRPWLQPDVHEQLVTSERHLLAEFRPVAPMFVSVDGIDFDAAASAARLDGLLREAQSIVTRHGGSVFTVLSGDKGTYLVVVFGAPMARGDDPRRAIAAADALRAAFRTQVRIGLTAGRVFAGLFTGAVFSVYSFLGDTANTAARLMGVAEPGQVLVSGAATRGLDRRFSLVPLEPLVVKGRSTPVPVSELLELDASSVVLSEPRHALPLVGRTAELDTIDAALERAVHGSGGVVTLLSEPGMGKSRLVNAAIGRAARKGLTVFAGECQPHGTATPYLPWRAIWHGVLGVPGNGSGAARRRALEEVLAAAAPQALPMAPLVGEVLDLELPDTDATRGMPTPVRRQVRHEVLAGVLTGRAAAGPLCIVLEDAHWMDSSSRDLLADLARAVRSVGVLLLVAHRPLEPGGGLELDDVEQIELAELTGEQAQRLATTLLEHLRGAPPDPVVVQAVLARGGGNPFFLEELAHEIGETDEAADLPTSLEGLILGRIDRLPATQRRVVRMASIIGRRFATDVLSGAYADTLVEERLPSDLEGLHDSKLVVLDTPEPDEHHLFRHAVVRDVAYETLSFGLREQLHEQVASYLEQQADSPPVELLAHHYARTRNEAKEAHYRRLAAERAVRAGAYADALEHVDRASALVARQPDGPEKHEQELELQLLLGAILLVREGQGSVRAKAAYDRARDLTRVLPPGPTTGRAIFGLWTYYLFQGLMEPSAELADEALALAAHAPDPTLGVMAHLLVAQTHMWTGRWDRAMEGVEGVYAGYDAGQHQAYVTQYAQNPRFTAGCTEVWTTWMQGRTEDAVEAAERAIADARALGHDFTTAIAFLNRPVVAQLRRDADALVASVGPNLEAAARAGNPFYISLAKSLLAFASIVTGDHEAGIDGLLEQYAVTAQMGARLMDPMMITMLAEGHLAAGRYADGLALLDREMPPLARGGRVSYLADHLRLRGELLLARDPDDPDVSLRLFAEAAAVAAGQGSLSFELRAQVARAAVLARLGRGEEGRAGLAPVLARFTQGHDDPDQVAARTLLTG